MYKLAAGEGNGWRERGFNRAAAVLRGLDTEITDVGQLRVRSKARARCAIIVPALLAVSVSGLFRFLCRFLSWLCSGFVPVLWLYCADFVPVCGCNCADFVPVRFLRRNCMYEVVYMFVAFFCGGCCGVCVSVFLCRFCVCFFVPAL